MRKWDWKLVQGETRDQCRCEISSALQNKTAYGIIPPVSSVFVHDHCETHLVETDSSSLLTEALTAEVEAVFSDETSLVGAQAAVRYHVNAAIQDTDCVQSPLTTDDYPCRTCGGERTRQRRESF